MDRKRLTNGDFERILSLEYFPDKTGKSCACSSICNALVLLGDRKTAQRVFDSYSKHEFVYPNGGTMAGVMPGLVSDLTDGRYFATLHTSEEFDVLSLPMQDQIHQKFPRNGDRVISTIREAVRQGRIRVHTVLENLKDLNYETPAIHGVTNYIGVDPKNPRKINYVRGNSAHYIVEAGHGSDSQTGVFIDDGEVTGKPYGSFKTLDLLELRRTLKD